MKQFLPQFLQLLSLFFSTRKDPLKLIKRAFFLSIFVLLFNSCGAKNSQAEKAKDLNLQGIELLQANPEKALRKFLEAAELSKEVGDYTANAGIAYMTLGRNDEALTMFEETIEIDPKYLQAYYNKGVILESLGNHIDAIESYKEALQITPDSPEIVYNLALAFEKSGQKKEAIENYSRFIQIASSSMEPAIVEAKSRIKSLKDGGNENPKEKRKKSKKK